MTERTALQTAAAIRAGTTTALAECDAAIARIEDRDRTLNAVVVRDFDRARAAARAFDETGDKNATFAGVPITVKESFDVAGLPTTWGFEEHRDLRPTRDAALVTRLKAAGAIVLGKTNVPPALADHQANNPVYGRTNNPHDPARVAGGSSGGSAVALAAGMVPLEIGSDIGGSIRVPAHFNGVWGLKPTYGALSREGHHFPGTDGHPGPISVTGPLARDADDLAAALDVLSDIPLPRPTPRGSLRLLIIGNHPVAPVDPAITAAIDDLADRLARAGTTVSRDVGEQHHPARQIAQYGRILSITLALGGPRHKRLQATLPDWFAMLDDQARCIRQWQALFERYDAVIAPVLGVTAFAHTDVGLRERTLNIGGTDTPFGLQFAFPGMATYPNLPACAVPLGVSEGLPLGVQVICDLHRDHDAIAIARHLHQLTGAVQ